MGGEGNKNSEGIIDKVKVDGTLAERTEQIESSIKSSMSYCNAHTLDEFRINSVLTRITPAAFSAYQKPIQNV
jgi:IMP dehydrogenase/GMP reductase